MYTAAQVAAELRRIADALDKEPELELAPYLSIYVKGDDKDAFLKLARAMPRPMTKGIDFEGTTYADFKLQYGFWRIKIPQGCMCTIKTPARPAEYDCASIFTPEEEKMLTEETETREQKANRLIRESGKTVHASDCSTSIAPAEEPGPCDCDA